MGSHSSSQYGDSVTVEDAAVRRQRPWEQVPIGADEARNQRPWERVPIEPAVSHDPAAAVEEAQQTNGSRPTSETPPIATAEEVEVTQAINETTRTAAVAALRELAINELA